MLELSATLQNTRQSTCIDWKALEKRKQILALKEFCSEEGFQFRGALSLFTVTDPCKLPSVNFDMSLRPTVRHTSELGQSWDA